MSSSADGWREVRVFISSTFRDMQAERDHLVKVVFPELRERMEGHRIHFVDVDLRWGVTREQADNDLALELCLDQIDACRPDAGNRRPFFIGILGERYGYVPGSVRPETLQRYGWIPEYPNHSITALEIIHGVLLNPPMRGQSFFYFRDPSFMSELPDEIRANVFEAENDEARSRLAALKQRVRESGMLSMEGYRCTCAGLRIDWRLAAKHLDDWQLEVVQSIALGDVLGTAEWETLTPDLRALATETCVVQLGGLEAFGRQVRKDLLGGIARQYPEVLSKQRRRRTPDPLALERDAHQRFAERHLRVYVGRDRVHRQLCDYLNGESQEPLVLTGPSGSGKSAILSRVATEYPVIQPELRVLAHFVGASASSTTLASMLRRLCQELQAGFGLAYEMPDNPSELSGAFDQLLRMIPEHSGAVVIIDALDQLDARDRRMGLHWLPEKLSARTKIVVSCLSDQGESILSELRARGHMEVAVQPLTEGECEEIVDRVPSLSAKTLDPEQRAALLSNPSVRNPLYLQVALEELRGFGSFEQLDTRIAQFGQAANVTALFDQVLERLEIDFGEQLVETIACLLAAARAGLSEAELQAMLTEIDPRGEMQVVLRQLRSHLQRRGHLVDFHHLALQRAVVSRYWDSSADPRWHLRVADHFTATAQAHRPLWETMAGFLRRRVLGRQDALHNARVLAELPWQLAEARDWQRLCELLSHVDFLHELWDEDEDAVRAYWKAIEDGSEHTMLAAYQPVLSDPGRYQVWNVAALLHSAGHLREALVLREHIADRHQRTGHQANIQRSLGNQALIMRDLGDLDGALALHREEERVYRKRGLREDLQRSLGNQAAILSDRGDFDRAMALHREEEAICRELGLHEELQVCLGNQAVILRMRGDLDGAMVLHRQEESICRELGLRADLQRSIGNQALVFQAQGALDHAMALHKEAEAICRELGLQDQLQMRLGNQALILRQRGDLDGAMALHQEAEAICRELGLRADLQRSLGNKALVLRTRGDLDGATALHKEQEAICRELGLRTDLQTCIGNQGAILKARGDMDGAMSLYAEAEAICRELGLRAGLQRHLHNQAAVLQTRGDLDRAMALYKEGEAICRELGLRDALQRSLGNQAVVLRELGDLNGAMVLHKEEEAICRELGLRADLQLSLGNQAVIHNSLGDSDGALCLYREAETICREIGAREDLQRYLNNQGVLLWERDDLDRAVALHREAEAICREIGLQMDLQCTLGNHALVLRDLGDREQALALHREEEAICRNLNLHADLQKCLGNQALVLRDLGDIEAALKLHHEEEAICREQGLTEELASSLANQANLLICDGQRQTEALFLVEEAHRLATAHRLTALLEQIRPIRDKVRSMVL